MSLKELVVRNRSYRRFKESEAVSMAVLEELVDLARQTASGANRQPLRYVLSSDRALNERIFPCLGWAGYMPDWPGPSEGERPAAYVAVLRNEDIGEKGGCDTGIAVQTLLLGAAEKGLGGCIIGSVNKEKLAGVIDVPQGHTVQVVVALGAPGETCVMEPLGEDGSIKYYRDEKGVHHVPKRSLDEVVLARHGR